MAEESEMVDVMGVDEEEPLKQQPFIQGFGQQPGVQPGIQSQPNVLPGQNNISGQFQNIISDLNNMSDWLRTLPQSTSQYTSNLAQFYNDSRSEYNASAGFEGQNAQYLNDVIGDLMQQINNLRQGVDRGGISTNVDGVSNFLQQIQERIGAIAIQADETLFTSYYNLLFTSLAVLEQVGFQYFTSIYNNNVFAYIFVFDLNNDNTNTYGDIFNELLNININFNTLFDDLPFYQQINGTFTQFQNTTDINSIKDNETKKSFETTYVEKGDDRQTISTIRDTFQTLKRDMDQNSYTLTQKKYYLDYFYTSVMRARMSNIINSVLTEGITQWTYRLQMMHYFTELNRKYLNDMSLQDHQKTPEAQQIMVSSQFMDKSQVTYDYFNAYRDNDKWWLSANFNLLYYAWWFNKIFHAWLMQNTINPNEQNQKTILDAFISDNQGITEIFVGNSEFGNNPLTLIAYDTTDTSGAQERDERRRVFLNDFLQEYMNDNFQRFRYWTVRITNIPRKKYL